MTNSMLFYVLMFGELGLVIWLSARINKMSSTKATALYILYSALNGVTMSFIFIMYTQASIQSAFLTSACGFAGLSMFGYVTKKDLGPIGSFVTMGLWGLIGYSIISMFFPSMMGGVAGQVYGLVGILIFAGLTAYDTQLIKQMAPINQNDSTVRKSTIMGALKLYLDFINLFLFILRFMGNRRN
jgi:hypothetical protein